MKHAEMYVLNPKEKTLRLKSSQTFEEPKDHGDYPLEKIQIDDDSVEFSFTIPFHNRNCDEKLQILNKDTWIIYASGALPFSYHDTMRSTKVANFFQSYEEFELDSKYPTFDIQIPKFEVPTKSNSYFCVFQRLPSGENTVIGDAPIVKSELLHHIVMRSCSEKGLAKNGYEVGKPFECELGMPRGCIQFLSSWAPGGSVEVYPEDAGKTIGKEDSDVAMIQMHYNNPSGKSGIYDDSGITLSYTNEQREKEIRTIIFGIYHNAKTFRLEPGVKELVWDAWMSPECSTKYTRGKPRKIYGVGVHGHLKATDMTLTQVRKGKELRKIVNKAYDFNFQGNMKLGETLMWEPEDVLKLTCIYDTSKETEVTIGGDYSEQEMCYAFIDVIEEKSRNMDERLPGTDLGCMAQTIRDQNEDVEYKKFDMKPVECVPSNSASVVLYLVMITLYQFF